MSEALGPLPQSSQVIEVSDVPGDFTVSETVMHSSQTSVSDGAVASNTAIGVEKKVQGSLFAGAVLKQCTINIHIPK